MLGKDFGHLAYGYTSTSHASQGRTVDRVLIAMGHESVPAMNAEQFYVSVSRGRERATIYTDLSPATLRQAIQKHDARKSATELMAASPVERPVCHRPFIARVREAANYVREQVARAFAATITQEREYHVR